MHFRSLKAGNQAEEKDQDRQDKGKPGVSKIMSNIVDEEDIPEVKQQQHRYHREEHLMGHEPVIKKKHGNQKKVTYNEKRADRKSRTCNERHP